MASWGNEQDQPFDQDMDSDGRKLRVRSSILPGDDGYRTQLSEYSNNEARKALEVRGSTLMKHSNVPNELDPQTSSILVVEADTVEAGQFAAVIKDASINSQALRIDGTTYIYGANQFRGRLNSVNIGVENAALGINNGNGPDEPADPNIIIGQTESDPAGGNITALNSVQVKIRGGGTPTSSSFPVAINGPVVVDNYDGEFVSIRMEKLIQSTGIKLPSGENVIQIGKFNREVEEPSTSILIGEGAGETGANKRGSDVTIRGDVTIQAGNVAGTTNPGDLIVARNVDCNGRLLVQGFSLLQGNVDMSGTANVDGATTLGGNLTVGTPTTAANTTLNGELSVSDDVTLNQDLEMPGKFKVTDAVACQIDTICQEDLRVD